MTTEDLPLLATLAREIEQRGGKIRELELMVADLTGQLMARSKERDELRALLQEQAVGIKALKAQMKELEW